MRSVLLPFAAVASLVAFSACVGDTPTQTPPDATADVVVPVDSGMDSTASDGGTDAPAGDAGVTLPVTAALKLWLRADIGVTKGPPFTWADQSPLGNDALRGLDAGVAGFPARTLNYFPNGMPAMVFTTEPQVLTLPEPPAFSDATPGVSFFIVAQPTTTAVGLWLNIGNATNANRIGFGQGATNFFVALGTTVHAASGAAGTSPANQVHLYEVTITGAGAISFYRDGQTAGTAIGAALTLSARTPNTIGGGIGSTLVTAPCALGEIIVYARPVTPGERTDVEAYLKARWATP